MTLIIKFIASFAATGLLISLCAGFLAGNRLVSILVTGLVCLVLSAALGAGVYKVLEIRVPEFLEIFESSGLSAAMSSLSEDGAEESSLPVESSSGDFSGFESGSMDGEGAENQAFGDHILVDNIKIKNEPKLMAEAIRTLLAKDEMNEG